MPQTREDVVSGEGGGLAGGVGIGDSDTASDSDEDEDKQAGGDKAEQEVRHDWTVIKTM